MKIVGDLVVTILVTMFQVQYLQPPCDQNGCQEVGSNGEPHRDHFTTTLLPPVILVETSWTTYLQHNVHGRKTNTSVLNKMYVLMDKLFYQKKKVLQA